MTGLKQDRDRLISEWQAAYEAANDATAPTIKWEHGWFIISSRMTGSLIERVRRKKLEAMRDTLIRRKRDSNERLRKAEK